MRGHGDFQKGNLAGCGCIFGLLHNSYTYTRIEIVNCLALQSTVEPGPIACMEVCNQEVTLTTVG